MALVREICVCGAVVRIWDDAYADMSEAEKEEIRRSQQAAARALTEDQTEKAKKK